MKKTTLIFVFIIVAFLLSSCEKASYSSEITTTLEAQTKLEESSSEIESSIDLLINKLYKDIEDGQLLRVSQTDNSTIIGVDFVDINGDSIDELVISEETYGGFFTRHYFYCSLDNNPVLLFEQEVSMLNVYDIQPLCLYNYCGEFFLSASWRKQDLHSITSEMLLKYRYIDNEIIEDYYVKTNDSLGNTTYSLNQTNITCEEYEEAIEAISMDNYIKNIGFDRELLKDDFMNHESLRLVLEGYIVD